LHAQQDVMAKATYKEAGVNLEIYRQSMARLPRLMRRTHSPRVIPLEGGFAGLFQLDFPNPLFARNYKEPVLVSCTDGVGTKLKVAQTMGVHNTVGIDLVAMSVNDALCCGAEPLFFLDYVAMSHDDTELLEQIVDGISQGCVEADCALLGGETAIMPDLYRRGDYDLAGFVVGVAEKKRMITGAGIEPEDVVLGVASSGFHSNGYSLVRKVVFEMAKLSAETHVPELGGTVGEALLRPTKIYVRPIRAVLNYYKIKSVVHGIAHITGGGLCENLERILPESVRAVLVRGSWTMPPLFPWLAKLGEIEQAEMDSVFNMGLGLALIVRPHFAESIRHQLEDLGHPCFTIGRIEAGQREVTLR
jgi:phosphoribosylformylglycinamidine cyclo-ligase